MRADNHDGNVSATAEFDASVKVRRVSCWCRFYTEEAFSFNVHRHASQALRVLDMQDLHSLRQGLTALTGLAHMSPHSQAESMVRDCKNTGTWRQCQWRTPCGA